MKQPAVLDHLHYIAKRTFKGHALFLSMGALDDKTRAAVLNAAAEYEQAGSCLSFPLQNKDTVLFFNNNKVHHLMLLALKIKTLVGTQKYPEIVSAYDLKKQYALLYNRIYKIVLVPDTDALHSLSVMRKIPHKPFTLNDLKTALHHLGETSLTHLIRKQPVWQTAKSTTPVFTGWFVSLSDIRRALIPDVDIRENAFYYALLRQAVELKVLEKIMEQPDWTGGVNLSVQAFQSGKIKKWLATHTPAQKEKIVFEFAFDDFIRNADSYTFVHETLAPQGYQFSIRFNTLPLLLNMDQLPADYIKIPAETAAQALSVLSNTIVYGVYDNALYQKMADAGFTYIQSGLTGIYPGHKI